MRVALGTVVRVGSLAVGAAPAAAQECCDQGKAEPWKGYNAGIRWEAAISPNPVRTSARDSFPPTPAWRRTKKRFTNRPGPDGNVRA